MKRTVTLRTCVTEAQAEHVERWAEHTGHTVSTFLSRLILAHMEAHCDPRMSFSPRHDMATHAMLPHSSHKRSVS